MCYACIKYKSKVDFVLIDTYSTQNFYYALVVSKLCRLLNLDYVPILHGGNLTHRLKNNPKWSQAIFNLSKFNVSPSLFLKESFEALGYTNIIHIPNAIALEDYLFTNKTYDNPRLLWVRSFSKIYNPELAIHVFKSVKKDFPKAKLCMVGPDADGSQKQVEDLAHQFNLKVKFTGKLKKKEWLDLSQNYNVFINTTNFDNTPVSVIEAMALGLPIVSTNVGGMPYLISNGINGLLVKANDAESMSQAITSLFDDSEKRKNMINSARVKISDFAWNKVKLLWIEALS